MKTKQALLSASITSLILVGSTQADNSPIGNISTNGEVFRAGTYPEISWEINHEPTEPIDLILITSDGDIIAKGDLKVQVRVLAADVQELSSFWNGFMFVKHSNYVTTSSFGAVNGRNWRQLFEGTHSAVDPTEIVWSYDLSNNDVLSFSAKAHYTSLKWHTTNQTDDTVLILKNGQIPPAIATWDTQTTLGAHISPYLNSNGRISMGPQDLIIAFELTGEPKNGNNGHGNNADGYDSSNKGKKPGIDLSGDFDDENKAVTSGDDVDPIDFQDTLLLLTFSNR